MFSPGCIVHRSEDGFDPARRIVAYAEARRRNNALASNQPGFGMMQADVARLQIANRSGDPSHAGADAHLIGRASALYIKENYGSDSLREHGPNGNLQSVRNSIRQISATHAGVRNSPARSLRHLASQLRFHAPLSDIQERQLIEHRNEIIDRTLATADPNTDIISLFSIAKNLHVLNIHQCEILINLAVAVQDDASRSALFHTLGKESEVLSQSQSNRVFANIAILTNIEHQVEAIRTWAPSFSLIDSGHVNTIWANVGREGDDQRLRSILGRLKSVVTFFPVELKQPILRQIERLRRMDNRGELDGYYMNQSLAESRENGIEAGFPRTNVDGTRRGELKLGAAMAGQSRGEIEAQVERLLAHQSPTVLLPALARISATLDPIKQQGLLIATHFENVASEIAETTNQRVEHLERQALPAFYESINTFRALSHIERQRREREVMRETIRDFANLDASDDEIRTAQAAIEAEELHLGTRNENEQNSADLRNSLTGQLENHVRDGERLIRMQTQRILGSIEDSSASLALSTREQILGLAEHIGYESAALAQLTTRQTHALMNHINHTAHALIEDSRRGMRTLAELQTAQNRALIDHVIEQADRAIEGNLIGFEQLRNLGDEGNNILRDALHAEVNRAIISGQHGLNQLAALQGTNQREIERLLSTAHRELDNKIKSPEFKQAIEKAEKSGKSSKDTWGKIGEFGQKIVERGCGQEFGRFLDWAFKALPSFFPSN